VSALSSAVPVYSLAIQARITMLAANRNGGRRVSNDWGHAAGLAAARADGGARTNERGLKAVMRRPGQAGQAHARIVTASEIAMRSPLGIESFIASLPCANPQATDFPARRTRAGQ
jgi:hypothetical protein